MKNKPSKVTDGLLRRLREAAWAADEMLTKDELAAKCKVAPRTIENWMRDGYLPHLKIAKVVLFHWPTVLAHLQANFSVVPPSLRTGPLSEGGKP